MPTKPPRLCARAAAAQRERRAVPMKSTYTIRYSDPRDCKAGATAHRARPRHFARRRSDDDRSRARSPELAVACTSASSTASPCRSARSRPGPPQSRWPGLNRRVQPPRPRPRCWQGHIQLALSDTPRQPPCERGQNTMFVSASATARRRAGLRGSAIATPLRAHDRCAVAMPSRTADSPAPPPRQSLSGSCTAPAVCWHAPPGPSPQRSTLFVSQSLHATASSLQHVLDVAVPPCPGRIARLRRTASADRPVRPAPCLRQP